MLALVVAFFAVQAGYQGFTAALPVALVKAGLPDAEIGLIVGVASVVQVPAALFAGGLIDRFGGPRILLLGALAYLGGAVLLTLPMAAPSAAGAVPFFMASRVLQGIGVSMSTPAAFAIVPGLVDRSRVGVDLDDQLVAELGPAAVSGTADAHRNGADRPDLHRRLCMAGSG